MPAPLFTLDALHEAAALVRGAMPPTPQYPWPLLAESAGCRVWLKHENHTPIGAFKLRGGIVYIDALRRSGAAVAGVITATRGNHGQSIALAAARAAIAATILVPHGNSVEKNAAMRGFGAEVIEHGRDFDEARVECARIAAARGLHVVPSFHPDLVRGVATYALELFTAVETLDTVYVPIGMGSGIAGTIAARDLLGRKTEIVGVVAAKAPAMALSFAAGHPVPTATAPTFADGMATREPDPLTVAIVRAGAARIVTVTEDQIAEAIRLLFRATHQAAEGAGAAALAAAMSERARMAGKSVAAILSGGNIDTAMYRDILAGATPQVG